jgi:hypothetical protein
MGGATGVPLAAGLAMFREGLAPGVFSPEGIIDPEKFLDVMAPLCNPPFQKTSDILVITRSWEDEDIRKKVLGF